MAPRPPYVCPPRRARFAFHRKPPDLYPEILQRLQQEIAAKAAAERAANAQQQIQPATVSPTQNLDPQQISQEKKEKPAMPATVTSHAKAALRARKPARQGRSNAKSPSRRSLVGGGAESAFERHSRKCKICIHPDREAIEELFVSWHSPQSIHREFAVHHPFDWCAVYRHARAAGLYAKRSRNLRAVLDLLLERATNVPPTAHGVIAAVRAYSCLTHANQWVEPEKRVRIVNHVYRHDSPAPAAAQPASTNSAPASSDESATAAAAASPSSKTLIDGRFGHDSSLVTSHSSLPSNRQSSELGSPPTRI